MKNIFSEENTVYNLNLNKNEFTSFITSIYMDTKFSK